MLNGIDEAHFKEPYAGFDVFRVKYIGLVGNGFATHTHFSVLHYEI